MKRIGIVVGLLAVAGLGVVLIGNWASRDAFGATHQQITSAHQIDPPRQPVSKWFAKLNPSGKIFASGFTVFYFDRTQRGSSAYQDHVAEVAVKYSWSDLHGIPSPQFAAYWIGRLQFDQATTRQISVSQSWAKSRIFIDGVLVADKGDSGQLVHTFAPGDHLIEVEYINNWHTVEFKVTFDQPAAVLEPVQLATQLRQSQFAGAELYYVGLYESGKTDTSVDVTLPRTGKPALVWLDSYEAIDWKLIAPDGVAAAVIASSSPGSRITGGAPVAVFHAKRGFGVRSLGEGECNCTAGHFHCEERNDLDAVDRELLQLTGRRLSGAAAQYRAASVVVAPWNDAARLETRRVAQQRTAAKAQCEANADPDFDTMLD